MYFTHYTKLEVERLMTFFAEWLKVLQEEGRLISWIYGTFSSELKRDLRNAWNTEAEAVFYYVVELWKHSLEKRVKSIPRLNTPEKLQKFAEDAWYTNDAFQGYLLKQAGTKFSEAVSEKYHSDTSQLKKVKVDQIAKLEKQMEDIEQEKKKYRREAIKMGYSKEEINETTQEMDADIKRIQHQIDEFSENTEMEKYLMRLPEVLIKTFELASNVLQEKKNERIKEDILKLVELTTFELTVDNKKELKVKLFDVLDKLISEWNCSMEASMGVEPISTALQAAVWPLYQDAMFCFRARVL